MVVKAAASDRVVRKHLGKSLILSIVAAGLVVTIFRHVDAGQVWERYRELSAVPVAAILGLLAVNMAVVALRLRAVLYGLAVPVGGWTAFRASTAGQVAGLAVFQVVGHLAGRHAVLVRQGISGAAVTMATAYERVVMMLVGGAAFVAGAVVLLGRSATLTMLQDLGLAEVVVTAGFAVGLSLWLGRSRFEHLVIGRLLCRRSLGAAAMVVGLTAMGQLLVLGAFVTGIQAFQPEAPLLPVFAASAVVSFAAALPISVNGWGVREVSAVFAFGLLGIPAADALAVSVLVGLASTVVVLGAAPLAMRTGSAAQSGPQGKPSSGRMELAAAWILAHAVAVLIFFQVHLQWAENEQFGLPGALININFADPMAILGGCGFALYWLSRRRWPAWRWSHANLWFALASAVLLLGFGLGVMEFGVTSWALQNRLIGWLVLLAYGGTGALLASLAGRYGIRRLCETLIAAGAAVVLGSVALRTAAMGGWLSPAELTGNFQGFSSNRNAFAVQMAVCVAGALAYSPVRAKAGKWRGWGVLLGIILLGLWLSQSRAGLGTTAILLAIGVVGFADRKTVALGVGAALAMGLAVPLIPSVVASVRAWVGGAAASAALMGPPAELLPVHDTERWRSMIDGAVMWLQNPLFGAGLGAFMHASLLDSGAPLVIHNSLIWLLAELGVVGASVFVMGFVVLIYCTWRSRAARDRLLFMALLVFGLFSMVHEVLYQRIFWLVLGVIIAAPVALRRAARQSAMIAGETRAPELTAAI